TIHGRVYGGWGKSGATNNKVTISQAANQNTKVSENVYGGWGFSGAAKNKVTISQAANQDTLVSGSVYGGYSENGTADSNEVTITGGTIYNDNYLCNIFGGLGYSGVTNNKVTISQAANQTTSVSGSVFGGYSVNGTADSNEVTITGGTISSYVYGGYGYSGVKNNKVAISQADAQDTWVSGAVYGGYSDGETGTAESNEVTITGGTIDNCVYGGWGDSGAAENKVVIFQTANQTTSINMEVYGGYSDGENGTADSNTVEITGGTIEETVYGGWGRSAATNNKVAISQADGQATSVGNDVYGGYSINGTSERNQVTISGGTIYNDNYLCDIYGGRGYSGATNNKVAISQADGQDTLVSGSVYGGYSDGETGTADSNEVTITGGTIYNDDYPCNIYGGWGYSGAAENKVAISQADDRTTFIGGSVYGGFSIGETGTADSNTVEITGGTITGDVYGGEGYLSANNNMVTITGGTFDETISVIHGGSAYDESTGTAANNIININAPIGVSGIRGGEAVNSSGNTLNLGATGITVGEDGVAYTQIVGIAKDLAFTNGKTILTSTGGINDVETLDVSGAANLAAATTPGTMTLLAGNPDNFTENLKVKYAGGTQAIGTGLVVKQVAGGTETLANSVTMAYDKTHRVALADSNSKVNYNIESAVTGIDLSNWNGTASALSTGWTAASGLTVTGSGFTAPTATLGTSTDILTANVEGFFDGAAIDDALKNITTDYTQKENGITISGQVLSNVKADGTNLVYASDKAAIDNVALGAITYQKGATLMDGSDAAYDYSGLDTINTNDFSMLMTEDQARTAQVQDSMTLLKGNATLGNIETEAYASQSYSYTPMTGLTVDAETTGEVEAGSGSVSYVITQNQATLLNLGQLTWNNTYTRGATEAAYINASVDGEKISFTGVDSLATGDEMLLIANYGNSIRKVRGEKFTLGSFTGKGHAYYKDGNLYYVVDRGTAEPAPDVPAENQTEEVAGQTVSQDIVGGQAQGKGESTGNTANISNGAKVLVNVDGTGGDVTGGISEGGQAQGNTANVTGGSEVAGAVIGGKSDSGLATGNAANVEGSTVGTQDGGVMGAKTDTGEATSNTANVTNGSTVYGPVSGAISTSGNVSQNTANVTGSVIQPNALHSDTAADVYGAHTDSGEARENAVNVTGSTVENGNVIGGDSTSGSVSQNTANVTGGSSVNGAVIGGQTEGGTATQNEAAITGTKTIVTGNVTGGTSQTGTAEGNVAKIQSGSNVTGDVTGGVTQSGAAQDNEVKIAGKGTAVTGNVMGGTSVTGRTQGNKANITGGSSVKGEVTGGVSRDGQAANNEASINGGSQLEGSVTGGSSTSGSVTGNQATVAGSSQIDGSVYGGTSDKGTASGNVAAVEGNSTVTESVVGAASEK
ncbi:hypothetical protein, partial [uncultured Anaerovibrio sp.]|uniref:beta strand repeat-containing protein n=1 Tax=uncultured Anaerovibrio sp. TaxID=361586 RepID=UPI002635DD4C